MLLLLGFFIFIVVGLSLLSISLQLSERSQDLSSQAASTCSQAPINTQFRRSGSTTTSWVEGSALTGLKVGDSIDVNCFAKNGSAQLSGGFVQITRKNPTTGQTSVVALPSGTALKPQLDRYTLTAAGDYTFTCTNGSTCSNADIVKVIATSTPPAASPAASPSPGTPTSCAGGYKLSDLNKDCKTTIQDYAVFLEDFRLQTR